jgi:Protein of unknown function (DUF5818)
MRNARLFGLRPLVLLIFALNWSQAVLVAQLESDRRQPTAQQQQLPQVNQQQTNGMEQVPDLKTFSGTIVRSGDKLVLQDGIGESVYQLDDQQKVKTFEGKNVKVTGTIDTVTKTIQVARVEPEQ